MSDHTPTPWHWTIHDSSAASIEGPDEMSHVLTVSPCRSCRGEEWQWGMCTNPTEANAAFIVKAVNSHDALVKALEGLVSLGDTSIAEDIRKALRPHERASFDTAIRNGAVALASIKERT